jgi:hypothetical protein
MKPEAAQGTVLVPKQLRAEWVDVMALDQDLSNNALRVACVIGSYINKFRGDAYPRMETIAEKMRASARTVWAGVHELEARGYLVVKRRSLGTYTRKLKDGTESEVKLAGGKGVANLYQPAFERSQIFATTTRTKLAERCDLYWSERSQKRVAKVATDCDPTLTSSSKKNPAHLTGPSCPDGLGPVGARLRQHLGEDVYRSWFNKVTIKTETPELVVLSAPTRLHVSRIQQDYADKVLRAWQAITPTIQRVEVVVAARPPGLSPGPTQAAGPR